MHTNQGLTLDRYLEKKSPLEPAQAARIAMQIAQQLGSAGGSLLIHPGRILVTKTGTVQLLPPPVEELSLPAVVEYPAYASPEEIRGVQPDVRSALYSLGCTLFELLSGAPPFSFPEPKQILHAHLETPVPDVRENASAVPASLGEVLNELLEKDPELRIQTPAELIRRLKQSLGAAGAPAGGAKAPQGAPRPAPRREAAAPDPAPMPQAPAPRRAASSRPAPRPASSGLSAGVARARPRADLSGAPGAPSRRGVAARRALARPPLGKRGRDALSPDGDLEEEEEIVEAAPPQRTYYFTLGGAVLGMIAGLMVVHFVKQQNAIVESEGAIKIEDTRKAELEGRKATTANTDKVNREKATQLLANAKAKPPHIRKDILVNGLNSLCETPYSHPLADELLKVWSAEAPAAAAEVAKEDERFQKQKADAKKLEAEGRTGDAMEKWREDERDFSPAHRKEIDEAADRLDHELVEKWKVTQLEADKLEKDEPDKAVEVLKEALKYGTGYFQREATKRIEAIEAITSIQADSKNRRSSLDDADAKEEKPAQDGAEAGAKGDDTGDAEKKK
jgi:hypothetical protein